MAHFAGVAKTATSLNKEGWERSDFPILCETCLGANPYVRMSKIDFDKECKICTRPFTVFRWRPGCAPGERAAGAARYKKTEVCQTCAKIKNVCQTCLFDLQYGLPVQVRDEYLGSAEGSVIPKSDVGREYLADQAERRIAVGEKDPYNYGKMASHDMLLKLARTTPYYKRNRAHICSFFVKGECTRGDECPYRHEQPETGPLSVQNISDRYYGQNDPVAHKIMNRADLMPALQLPEDASVTTLYVGGLDQNVVEQDLRDAFYSYGEIGSIKLVPAQACAFVTYNARESAEAASKALANNLFIRGVKCKLMWGRSTLFDRPQPGALPEPLPESLYPTTTSTTAPSLISNLPPPPPLAYAPQFAPPGVVPPPPAPAAAAAAPAAKPYYPSSDPNYHGARV